MQSIEERKKHKERGKDNYAKLFFRFKKRIQKNL